MNSADIEQAEMERIGRAIHRAKNDGYCCHGWWRTRKNGTAVCLHCGMEFSSEEMLIVAGNATMRRYL